MILKFFPYILQTFKQVFYLPKTVRKQHIMAEKIKKISNSINDISLALEHNKKDNLESNETIRLLNKKINKLKKTNIVNNTISDNHSLDTFYKLFEDKLRGTEADIKSRISEYKPFFESLPSEIAQNTVIDLGCGRGEFLSFAKDMGLNAIGIDMNKAMIKRAKNNGYNVQKTDALSYILKQKTDSFAAITGFHVAEHIPFEILMRIFNECYRTLSPGGFALFETPNPKNILVSTNNFYIDPSHIKPIPPELLSFALESAGFITEIIYKHPAMDTIKHSDPDIQTIMNCLYGPQDYAVLARKV